MFPKTLHPSFVARGLTLGSAFATFYGTLWVINGINALHAPASIMTIAFILLAGLSISLAIACVRLFMTASLFPAQGDAHMIKQANRYINYATVIQVIISVGGPAILIALGRSDIVFPAIVVSVGLYLLALAPLLRIPHYYIAGTLLCVIPVAIVLFTPATTQLAGMEVNNWLIINGICSGIVFLGSGLTNMILAVRIRRGQYMHSRRSIGLIAQ